jgi:DNA invertase Pin-like site-specific DNA recombinase
MQPQPTAAIYCRVSTQDQAAEDKISLTRQIDDCTALAGKQGFVVPADLIFRETISGAADHRPVFEKMLAAARAKRFTRLFVWDQTRLSRAGMLATLTVLEELASAGVSVVSVADGELTDELLAGIRGWAAAQERAKMKSRTWPARAAKRDQGYWVHGQTPYGYRSDRERKFLVLCPHEAPIAREIFRMAREGTGAHAIAARLNDRGVLPPEIRVPRGDGRYRRIRVGHVGGGSGLQLRLAEMGVDYASLPPETWGKSAVVKILHNEAAVGILVVRDRTKTKRSAWSNGPVISRIRLRIDPGPLLTEAEYLEIREAMRGRRLREDTRRSTRKDYIATGTLHCAQCGSRYLRHENRGWGSYQCGARRRAKGCTSPGVSQKVTDRLLVDRCVEIIREMLPAPTAIREYLEHQASETAASIQVQRIGAERIRDALKGEWEQRQQGLERLARLGADDRSISSVIGEVKDLRSRLDDTERTLAEIAKRRVQIAAGYSLQQHQVGQAVEHVLETADLVHESSTELTEGEALTDLVRVVRALITRADVTPDKAVRIESVDLSTLDKRMAKLFEIADMFVTEMKRDDATASRIDQDVQLGIVASLTAT